MKNFSLLRSAVIGILSVLVLTGCTENKPATSSPASSAAASLHSHIHGLAVDRGDSSRLYIATHNGLFTLQNDSTLNQVGTAQDDYMGFSPHPTEGSVFFSSGHPVFGGNLGVQKSTDGGLAWKKLSDGDEHGPVDFHTMTVSEANPATLFGWYNGYVYRSEDSGITWKKLPGQLFITSFGTDVKNESILYAGTQAALLKSTDTGATWEPAFKLASTDDGVIDIDVDRESNTLWISTEKQGIMRSSRNTAGELTFETVSTLPGGEVALQLALDRKNPTTLYAGTEHMVYKSVDSGKTWKKVL